VAFSVRGSRAAIACVPRRALAEFFDDLEAGRLDDTINGFLASPPDGRVLRASEQTDKPGLFDELASPGAIVPPERVPGRRVFGGIGGGTPADARRNKNRTPRPGRALVVAAVITGAVFVAGVVALVARGGGTNATVAVGPVTTTVAPPFTKQTFNAQFTVTSENRGQRAEGHVSVGDIATSTVVVECNAVTCTFTSDSIGFDRGIYGVTFTRTGDHFDGARFDSGGPDACLFDAANLSSTIDLVRDAAGKITGFTGTYAIVHPNGVEAPDLSCASENLTASIVATLA
jgi:hypothetical protein